MFFFMKEAGSLTALKLWPQSRPSCRSTPIYLFPFALKSSRALYFQRPSEVSYSLMASFNRSTRSQNLRPYVESVQLD